MERNIIMNLQRVRSAYLLTAVFLLGSACFSANVLAEEISYKHSQVPDLKLSEQPLSGMSFEWSKLRRANFSKSNLTRTNFSFSQLSDCNFQDADLREANFYKAELINCNFQGAQVAGANFEGAIFPGSKVGGVDFSQARMNWSEMRGADFTPPGVIMTSLLTEGEITLSINFDYNKDTLREGSLELLAELAKTLNAPELALVPLRIEGHTDGDGAEGYNMDLSKRRALRVKTTLASKFNVDLSRMTAEGYGESEPIAPNNTDEGKQKNRRVKIINLAFGN